MPTFEEIAAPTLQALTLRGGSASIHELSEDVAGLMDLPDEILEIPHGDGSQSEFDYRAAWTRTYLKKMGAVDNSSRGVWSLTDYGRNLDSETDFRREFRAIGRESARRSRDRAAAVDTSTSDTEVVGQGQSHPPGDLGSEPFDEARDSDWRDELLATLKSIPPEAFERLCQRVLRESGFTQVKVTGQTGDGGIDGSGVLRVNLISFQVLFQCKRYGGSVGAGDIRDFRGAMVGRADKGLFLTTGRFSPSAEREAVRDGAPAIDLVDGLELCRLLKDLQLGVELVEEVKVDREFFESI